MITHAGRACAGRRPHSRERNSSWRRAEPEETSARAGSTAAARRGDDEMVHVGGKEQCDPEQGEKVADDHALLALGRIDGGEKAEAELLGDDGAGDAPAVWIGAERRSNRFGVGHCLRVRSMQRIGRSVVAIATPFVTRQTLPSPWSAGG